jgi:hypothetical protein
MYAGRGSTNSKAAAMRKTDGFAFSPRSAGLGTSRVGGEPAHFPQMSGATKKAYNFARSLSIADWMFAARYLSFRRCS